MQNEQEALRQTYIKQVRAALADFPQTRDRLLQSLDGSLDDYLAENPDATLADLYAQYGDPRQIAEDTLRESPSNGMLAKLRQNRRLRIALAAVAAVLVGLIIFLVVTKGVMVVNTETTVYTITNPEDLGMSNEELAKQISEQHTRGNVGGL